MCDDTTQQLEKDENYQLECLEEVISYLQNAQVGAHMLGHEVAEFRISRALSAILLPVEFDIFNEKAVSWLIDKDNIKGGE